MLSPTDRAYRATDEQPRFAQSTFISPASSLPPIAHISLCAQSSSTPFSAEESAYEADHEQPSAEIPSSWKQRVRKARRASAEGRTQRHHMRRRTLGGMDISSFTQDASPPGSSTLHRRSRRTQSLALDFSDVSLLTSGTDATLVGLGLGIPTIHIQDTPRAPTSHLIGPPKPRLRPTLPSECEVMSPMDGLPSPIISLPSSFAHTAVLPSPLAQPGGLGFALPRSVTAHLRLEAVTLPSPFTPSASPPWSLPLAGMLAAKAGPRKTAVGLGLGLPSASPLHTPSIGGGDTPRSDVRAPPQILPILRIDILSPILSLPSPILASPKRPRVRATATAGATTGQTHPKHPALLPVSLSICDRVVAKPNACASRPFSPSDSPALRRAPLEGIMSSSPIMQLASPLLVQSRRMFAPLLGCQSPITSPRLGAAGKWPMGLGVGLSPWCGIR